MNRTRYCSTCGTLLTQGAAICGECGARYQESPYERRATDAPGAWAQAPRPRSRDLGPAPEEDGQGEGIELISPQELAPRAPGATALRAEEQYDQVMVTQPPTSRPGPDAGSGPPGSMGSPAPAGAALPPDPAGRTESAAATGPAPMEPPLDGCVPATPLKRFLAAAIDAVIASLTMLPLMIGLILIIVQESATLPAQILVGVGAALPAAYTVLILWLVGAKGFSLGKLILGLRVTRYSRAGSIGMLRSLGRWFLYGLVWIVMALSIFLDPKKHLRGFHDRAVDSVVVDIKAGRHPLLPRPDDFERESPEHYLGSPSVPVTAHENLLAEPGAAWHEDAAAGVDSAAHGQGTAAESAWDPEPSAASPYAPPPSADPGDGSRPEVIGSPWSPPPAPAPGGPDGWGRPPQQTWQPPEQSQAPPAASWQPSHPGGAAAQDGSQHPRPGGTGQDAPAPPAQSWSPPSAAAPPGQQAEPAGASEVPQAPPPPSQPAPDGTPPYGAMPGEATTDAWEDIDEDTRLAPSAHSDLGDLEQTRISAVAPPVPTLRLVADDGTERSAQQPVVIGRNPAASEDEVLFVFTDETRSVSKTHLRIDGTGTDITVTDLGSTNGSAIVRTDGSRESLVPETPTVLPDGASLTIGDRSLTVERMQ